MSKVYSVLHNGKVVKETTSYDEATALMRELGGNAMVCYNLNTDRSTYANGIKAKATAKKAVMPKSEADTLDEFFQLMSEEQDILHAELLEELGLK